MRTKDQQFRDDDSDDDALALFERDIDPALDAWRARFERLARRARQHGFATLTVISTCDPLSNLSGCAYAMTGPRYQNIGAARIVLNRMENE